MTDSTYRAPTWATSIPSTGNFAMGAALGGLADDGYYLRTPKGRRGQDLVALLALTGRSAR